MKKKNEFLSLLCNLYIVGLTVALPLYTGGTYWRLGDNKYALFRSLSVLCLGIWLTVSIFRKPQAQRLSPVDISMLLYGGMVLLSAAFSTYEGTPWMGFREWYMGAFSQLMFVGIYFFVSRCYNGKKMTLYLWGLAFYLVVIAGIFHRLGIDSLGLMKGFEPDDWEYSHMLSTIGNINWFCGYCSVALVLPVAGYLKCRTNWKTVLSYIVSAAGLFLLMVQGSDIGIALVAVCLLTCLIWGMTDTAILGRTLLLAAGVFLSLPVYGGVAHLRGERALKALPADGIGWNVLCRWEWILLGVICLGLYIGLRLLQKAVRGYTLCILVLTVLAAVGAALAYMSRTSFDRDWGSGRGTLWSLALQGFVQGDWRQKLIGVGPDCFAEYIYSTFSGDALLSLEGRWANAVFANAHNEWLNHLVNLGIMGTGCYLGIFLTGAVRYRKYLPGMLAILLYGAASLTGFQQVLSTPLFFLMLGICENRERDKCCTSTEVGLKIENRRDEV